MSGETQVREGNGVGFVGLLTITFVVLKALGYLTWSWIWVFSPLWITGAFILFLLVIWGVLMATANSLDNRARKQRRNRLVALDKKADKLSEERKSTVGKRG